MPFNDPIKFRHQETEKLIKVLLINDEKLDKDEEKTPVETNEENKEGSDDEEKEALKKKVFQVKLERPSPAGVNLAEKNICFVEIVPDDADIDKD